MVQPYSMTNIAAAEDSRFIVSDKLEIYTVENMAIAVHALSMHRVTPLSVNENLLSKYIKSNFRGLTDEEI